MDLKHETTTDAKYVLLRRVAVKFLDDFKRPDGFKLPYVDGAEESFPGDLKEFWGPLAKVYPGITLKRVYTALTPREIQKLVSTARDRDKTYEAPNFLTFFAIDTPSLETAQELAVRLARWQDIVEYAYVQPLASLPAIGLDQKYLDEPIPYEAPTNNIGGIDSLHVPGWIDPGHAPWASGAGIRFVDIEKGWDLLHPSLRLGSTTSKITSPPTDNINLSRDTSLARQQYFNGEHGTNVLGILAANVNSGNPPNWKGISERATGYVISVYWKNNPTEIVQNIENSIMKAIRSLRFGDVILLELETQVKGYGASYWPIECSANLFPPIRLATGYGITVVEAAGNSGCDLDDANNSPFRKNPNDPHNPPNTFDPNPNYNQDSGAIIVGAAVVTGHGAARKGRRSLSSNYGSRVNCFAWGDTVHTLDIDINTGANTTAAGTGLTTPNFSGTSAAAAIVAGAAIVLQGICQRPVAQGGRVGHRLSAFEMRNKLSNAATGTRSANPNADKIGVMPNLKLIINSL